MPPAPPSAQTPSVLVVGATGLLGSEIVAQLRAEGYSVRALVRQGSDPARIRRVEAAGAQTALGDLKDKSSIVAACEGVEKIISTATALLSRAEGDSLDTVDLRGQVDLVDVAERAGVKHFTFVSFPPIPIDFAFQNAKRAVERRLERSSMSFTIVHAASFCEIWLSPMLGFDPANGYVRILGDGTQPTSWISLGDVARFTVATLKGGPFARATLALGGPDALSYHDILDLYASHGLAKIKKDYVSEAELERQLQEATEPRQQALAAFMLSTARGQAIASAQATRLWSGPFTTLTDYVARQLPATRTL